MQDNLSNTAPVHVVGGGLAGSEAAWQLARAGIAVVLHEEMRRCGSLILAAADAHKLPAGGALAVDRDGFAEEVTRRLAAEPLIRLERGEVADLPPAEWGATILATGPSPPRLWPRPSAA